MDYLGEDLGEDLFDETYEHWILVGLAHLLLSNRSLKLSTSVQI